MKNCPVCDSTSTRLFLERRNVPVHQNLLFQEQEQARSTSRGDLEIAVCQDCGFVFNAAFSAQSMSYDQSYENTQNYSPLFEAYVDETADYLISQKGVRNSRVTEVGCGKGGFLWKLVERGGNRGTGFDPSYIGPLEALNGKLVFRQEFYDDRHSDLVSDFVVCRHVLEHVEDPISMLISIRKALRNSEDALVFFETPDVEWILENKVVWDFFYEHCSYFSSGAIRTAIQRAGFRVENVKRIFGGQYLWVEARPGRSTPDWLERDAGQIPKLAEAFGELDLEIGKQWKEQVVRLSQEGSLLLWGAGAKGVTFANLFDPHREHIRYLVDVNPNKQGKFTPGTGHPIVSPAKMPPVEDIAAVIVMNPNYRHEIEEILRVTQGRLPRLVEFSARSWK